MCCRTAPKKNNYDQFGHAGVDAGAAGGAGRGGDPFEAFRRAQQGRRGGGQQTWQPNAGTTVEDFDMGGGGGGGNFSEMFEQLFGAKGGRPAGRGTQARQPAAKGADVEHPVKLTFEQAARGTMLPLQIESNGKTETIEIKIPAGVKDGSRIRIRGRGQKSQGEPGDLYILTAVQPHAYYRRDGLDIYMDLPLSMYEAVLGTKVEVPTLDGPFTLTVPPGVGGGTKMRIKGRGIERGAEKGDQFVEIRVKVPKTLELEDRELIEKLAVKYPVNARAEVTW